MKYTSSCLEISGYISKIGNFWKLIDWPDHKSYAEQSVKLMADLTKMCTRYSTMLVEFYQTQQIILQMNTQTQQQSDTKNPNQIEQLNRVFYNFYNKELFLI